MINMANVRIPLVKIDAGVSTPLGVDKCIIIDAIADGTCKVGYACKADTTNPNKMVLATVGAECGVVIAGKGLKLGDTPTANTAIKVCIHGPVVASVTAGADNIMAGAMLCAHASTGTFIRPVATAGSATSTSAHVLDWRASDDANYHLIFYKGLSLNSNTHE